MSAGGSWRRTVSGAGLAWLLAAEPSGIARADVAPPDQCLVEGATCKTAGPSYDQAGLCTKTSCQRGSPDGAVTYECLRCLVSGGGGGTTGGGGTSHGGSTGTGGTGTGSTGTGGQIASTGGSTGGHGDTAGAAGTGNPTGGAGANASSGGGSKGCALGGQGPQEGGLLFTGLLAAAAFVRRRRR